MNFAFEQGPIRPPSEAKSLLVRATRNCPWNKCTFCHTYRGRKFGLRTVEEIKEDIQKARDIADQIREMSWGNGESGEVTEPVLSTIFSNGERFDDSFRSVTAWLYFGGESVFIQDANSIIMKTDDLVEVLSFIREKFPGVERITSYCRSKTASRKSVEEFKRLHKAGLSRIHIGMETGYDPLLKFIRKGVTAAEHIEGGKRIRASGISLSEYVMPGLGGDRWSKEHAEETAKVLNQINPQFIRLRTLQVRRDTDLSEMMKKGEFRPIGDEDILKETGLFIKNLDGIESTIVSDHILNLLEELEGTLPVDKERLLTIIDRYFSLSEEERVVYRLGRRRGIYRKLDDLSDLGMYHRLKNIVEEYRAKDQGQLDRDLYSIMHNYI
ncbi:MAG: radical SAM protein [Thermodesulfobacteriota bacterium]|nr:radical SAM protein [Thermodesulfobacteriota bacterium]